MKQRLWSNVAVHPGELLLEELESIDMTQLELASRLGRPPQLISEIISGKKAITHETALELEKALGVPAHIWVNLESACRITQAKMRNRDRL